MTEPSRCAAIYARISTDKQSKTSLLDQIRKCREYAEAHRLTVLDEHVFIDEGLSGVGADRAEFQRMMDAALSPSHPFAALLVDDTSRLSRNTEDALSTYRRLEFARVQLVAVSQGITSENEQADVFLTVHGMVDSLYVKELAKKVHRGLEGLALRGLSTGGRCFGYDAIPVGAGTSKQLAVNESEAAVVRRIFEMSAAGVSLKRIVAVLNAERVPPPRPRNGRRASWCPTAVREMLRRELYRGRVIWNRSRFVKRPGTNRRVCRPRPESEWKITERPELRIVSDQLWHAVVARIEKFKTVYAGRGNGGLLTRAATSPYLFSGILKCAECGGNLVIISGNKGRHRRYGCANYFYRKTCSNALTERQEWLEEKLLSGLQEQVLKPEVVEFAIAEFGRALKADLGNLSGELARMRDRKRELEEEMARYAEAIGAGGNMPALIAAMKARQSELDAITDRLLSTEPGSIDAKLGEIRTFVTSRIADLRTLLSKDVALARAEVIKHVREIEMTPQMDGEPHYEAHGDWDLLGETVDRQPWRQVGMVAGVGFEPTASGPARGAAGNRSQPDRLIQGSFAKRKEVVAGVGFEPTTSGL